MKKATIMAFLLVALAPVMSAWAGPSGSTTYYAALKAQVSSTSSGMGKVYAGTSNSAPSASSYNASSSQSGNQSSTTENEEKTFYAFAQANDGYEFAGWSTTENGTTYASTASPYSVKVKCSSSTESKPTVTTVYANFKKKMLAAFNITFETSSTGSYTVDGAAPANKTGLTEATSVTLASSDPNFLNWLVNGIVVAANPYTASYMANTTISAEFLTADQVTSVATLDDLTSALSNAQYKKITIPSGTTLQIPKGTTVTVPSGKQLVMDGTLIVLGTLSNSGAISGNGTLYKISYKIDQSDVITVYTADGKECGAMTCTNQNKKMPRYCKTTVTANTPTVSGTIGCTTTWGVLLNGTTAYAISKQSPKAVKVNVDTAKDSNDKQSVVNKITSVVVNGDVDEVTENTVYVLFANCSATAPLTDSKLNNQGVVDCAGKTLSASKNSHSSFGMSILNGSFSASAAQWQNAHAAFFNMSSVSLSKIKGTGSTYYFYDCGTSASACSLSFAYYSSTRSSDYRTIYLYSGYYSYAFSTANDSGKCNVYGGSFTNDPTNYIPTSYDGVLSATYDGSKYYVVGAAVAAETVARIGEAEYPSLADAITAAKSGDTIKLDAAIDLGGATVTVPQGKNITISLENHAFSNGKLVNNGTLVITDSNTGKGTEASDDSGAIVSCDIENNGTLDIIFGKYTGAIVNKGGTLTTHNGLFTGSFTKQGGTVNLNGGHFSADVENLATVEGTKVFRTGNLYSVCELPNGTMSVATVNQNSGYGATPYINSDYQLLNSWYNNHNSRSDYLVAEWERLAELLCFYQVFNNHGLDATLSFDRDVAKNTLNLYASASSTMNTSLNFDLQAGVYYRALSEVLIANHYASKTYKALWDDGITSVAMAVTDKPGGNNAGTVCTAMVELWESVRASDYSSTGHKLTNTVFIVGAKRFTIGAGSKVAMIRPETGAATFYATVSAALAAVEDGGTVMLANDSADDVVFAKVGTYTIDANGFAFSGSVTAAEGFTVASQGEGVYVVTANPVAKVDVETVVTQVVSAEWLDENNIDANASPDEIQAAVQEKLKEEDTNGNAKWENLVIGQKADETAAVTAANGGTETTVDVAVTFEVPKDKTTGEKIETGYTVKYAFDKTDSNGTVEGEAQENPTIDFTEVEANEPTYFTMRAVLEAKDDTNVTVDVPVEKTIGVVKVASEAEVTILPVPWQSLGDGDIKASELVHAASLSDDDELIVYGADGKPQTWVVKDGEWTTPAAEYTIGGGDAEPQEEESQEAAGLKRGQGVILKRKDTNKDIVLIGQPVSGEEPVETPITPATEEEPSWNLVASPKMDEVDISTAFTEEKGNTSDEIIVPTAGTPKHYTYKNGEWGYPGADSVVEIQRGNKTIRIVTSTHKTDDNTVPAGMGFWYLNKSADEDKKISW